MRFRYLYRLHRRWKIRPRGHPIPDLIQVSPQILLEALHRHAIHPGGPFIGLNPPVRLPHQLLRYRKRLVLLTRLAHSSPPRIPSGCSREQTLDEPAPSLRSRYRSFVTTTSRSAGGLRIGTQHLTISVARCAPSRHPPPAAGKRQADRYQYRNPPSHVPCRSRRTGSRPPMPDTAWPVNGLPPDSSRDRIGHPGSDVSF